MASYAEEASGPQCLTTASQKAPRSPRKNASHRISFFHLIRHVKYLSVKARTVRPPSQERAGRCVPGEIQIYHLVTVLLKYLQFIRHGESEMGKVTLEDGLQLQIQHGGRDPLARASVLVPSKSVPPHPFRCGEDRPRRGFRGDFDPDSSMLYSRATAGLKHTI